MNDEENHSPNSLASMFPEVREDLGLVFLRQQLQLLGVKTVVTEFDGSRGITFQVFDRDHQMKHVKMEWFPNKRFCGFRHSWFTSQQQEFSVNAYITELPTLDKNYAQEMADEEFFVHLEVLGTSAKEILTSILVELKENYGVRLAIYPEMT